MENPAIAVRDAIVKALKKEESFGGMIAAEADGIAVAGADIALPGNHGGVQTFRIAVIPHNARQAFE